MAYNAVEMADWQISEAAEKNMPMPDEWRDKLGLEKEEVLPMGRLAKLNFLKIIERLKDKPRNRTRRFNAQFRLINGHRHPWFDECGFVQG